FTEKEHLCLFAFPNETWQVKPPTEMVPPELPEPVLGINFSRDLMQEKDWLTNVSLHSDSWLLSVAFHMATDYGFDKSERERLFKMINDLPTIVEVVSGNAKEEVDEEGATLCGACGAYYGIDGFWICCDLCNKWFHGTCVKITAAEAEYIEHYKCPTCSNEGAKV
ncbi:PHD finger protein ALFIN-LIKE 6-like, partial [Olea europaea var. sylvestris]|uniref:PHD finger protein ALFIN-LIKE 6-like n=1 Tax=Olea europaea var. sylvestris TaxID=158386 RepID=UPI000C1CFB34